MAEMLEVKPNSCINDARIDHEVNIPIHTGGYNLGGFCVALTKTPSKWHQFWMRVCLGWKWEDYA